MNRVNSGEWLECKLYRLQRDGNLDTYSSNAIVFYARVLGDRERYDEQVVTGAVMNNVSLALYTTNLGYEPKQNDRVEVLGQKKLVSGVSIVLGSHKNMLGANRRSSAFIKYAMPKILRLI